MDQPSDPSGSPQPGQSRPPLGGTPSSPPPPPAGYMHAPYAAPKGGGVLQKLAVTLVSSVLLISLLMNVYFVIIFQAQFGVGLSEAPYAEGSAKHKVVILEVTGTIDGGMAEYMRQAFEYLDQNTPDALVLRIDSGGGGVTASDQIWHYFKRFKSKHDIPVVASFGTVAASGGYYIAAPADHIVCEITGITGSIGVMAQAPTLGGLMDKVGVKWETMVADGSPDKDTANDIYRDWTEADRAVFKRLLNHAQDRFIDVVAEGRVGKLDRDAVVALSTGDIYTASEAEQNKLIDQVGYLDDAVAHAAQLAGVPSGTEPTVTRLQRPRPFNLLGLLMQSSQADLTTADPEQVRSWLSDFSRMRIEYRTVW